MKPILLPLFLFWTLLFYGQDVQIKTAQLFNPNTNDLSPFISKSEYLVFSFDDMSNLNRQNYSYKIVRYDRNWEKSDLFTSEFLNGYETNYFTDYQSSFNTYSDYTHYQVNIPNRDFSFKLSGNYAVQLLSPKGKLLLEKRFSVYDDWTEIGVNVERLNSFENKNQQVEVRVSSANFDLTQNSNESKMVILKNNNWNEKIEINDPVFATPSQFNYNQLSNVFSGGVEYEYFDTKNVRIAGLTTEKIVTDSLFNIILYPNLYNSLSSYHDQPDVNGNYYIRNASLATAGQMGNQSEYAMVHFALQDYEPAENEEICVYGAFSDFECTDETTLRYVPENQMWECAIFLKQGYYNYSFAVKNKDTGGIDYDKITGSYWQTENMYSALMYYRPWGKRYDLLIGYGEGYSRPSQR